MLDSGVERVAGEPRETKVWEAPRRRERFQILIRSTSAVL